MKNLRKAFHKEPITFAGVDYIIDARRCIKCGYSGHKPSWNLEYNNHADLVYVSCPECQFNVAFLPLDREE